VQQSIAASLYSCVFAEEKALVSKKTPLVLKLVRHADCSGHPFELYLVRCQNIPAGAEYAMSQHRALA